MELRQFRYFIAVAETKSLTKSAELLHLAQPALSHSIKNLESELGVELFIRSRKGMALTDAGEKFLTHAKAVIEHVNNAKECLLDSEDKVSGSVSIGLPASIANVLSIPLYSQLKGRYPDIRLSLEEGLTGNLYESFKKGVFDIMIGFDAEVSDDCHAEPLILEDLYLAVPYSSDCEPEVTPQELSQIPLLVTKIIHGMGHTALKYAQQQNINLQMIPSTASLNPMLKLIEADLGNAILSWPSLFEAVENKKISARKIVEPPMQRTVSILYSKSRPLSNASSKVMEIIRQSVSELHGAGKWHGRLLVS